MTAIPQKDHPVQWLAVGSLDVVWAEAQRGLRRQTVEQIMNPFDPDQYGFITVCLPNGDGIYHVVDGQHRVAAVREMFGDGELVPCEVVGARTPEEAARIWLGRNTARSKPSALDAFRVAVTAGYPVQVAVNNVANGLGFRFDSNMTDGLISAVSACLTVARRHGIAALSDTLTVIKAMWGMQHAGVDGLLISGVASFLAGYPSADRDRLVACVSRQYTPARLLGAARTAREMFRGSISKNVMRVLLQSYNQGLKEGRRLDEAA